jgi:GT2 family glycosyltransferase
MINASSPSVSVIIPMKNAASTIGETLAALRDQRFADLFEVVVADNGSTDASADIVREFASQVPQVRCIDASGQAGPAHARNVGARSARTPLVAFCDADDIPSPDWLSGLVWAQDGEAAVGGRLEYSLLNDVSGGMDRQHMQTIGLPKPMGYLPFSSSANLLVPRSAFERVGGFDERLIAGEDVDFCWRLQQAGFELRFAADAVVHYRLGGSPSADLKKVYRYAKGDALLYRLHASRGARRRTTAGTIYSWSRLIVTSPSLLMPKFRRGWLKKAVKHAGWLVGSVRHRVVYL